MSFELFKKKRGPIRDAPDSISINKAGFSFGPNIIKYIGDNTHIEIYLDCDKNKIGLRPTKDVFTGFKIQKVGSSWGMLSKVAARLNKGIYLAKPKDGMIIINVGEIAHK